MARYNSVCTGKSHIFCGVPQRSILAPLLFLIYINDICCASNIFHFILFANDTNLFLSHKNLQYLTDQANHELIKLSLWPTANKLWINLKKNNFMILTKTKKKYPIIPKIFPNDYEIDFVNHTSFLGVILDEQLTWKPHISLVTRKCLNQSEL